MCIYFKQPLMASPWLYREVLHSYACCNQYFCAQGQELEHSPRKGYSLGGISSATVPCSCLGTGHLFLPPHLLPLKLGPHVYCYTALPKALERNNLRWTVTLSEHGHANKPLHGKYMIELTME